jgi:hypothetical protein
VPVEFVVAPANRQVREVDVAYRVQDAFGNEVSHGKFALPLQDNVQAKHAFSFTPTENGLVHRFVRAFTQGPTASQHWPALWA